ncbi:MAG TPA: hypothetical protein VGE59_04450 [Patescibacteria group bacterium]
MSSRNRRTPLMERLTNNLVIRYKIGRVDIDELYRAEEASWLWLAVSEEIRLLSPEQLGRLASDGLSLADSGSHDRTALYHVHLATWLDKRSSGLELLQRIAATAVIARLVDRFPRFAQK